MGKKYVKLDNNSVVLDPYDERFGNVPADAVPITDEEFLQLSREPCHYFEIVAGKLVRRSEATNIEKDRIVKGVDDTDFMKAFVVLLIDEINILRQAAGLPLRTVAQFKTAMKNKL